MSTNRLITGPRLRRATFPLVLGCEVASAVSVRGGLSGGAGTIKYKINKSDRNTAHLHISGERVWIFKNVEQGINILDTNIRSNVRAMFDQEVEYDTRALAYSLGRRLALLGVDGSIDNAACQVLSYSGAAGAFTNGDFAVTPGPGLSNGVLTAYAHLCCDCGLQRLFVVDDTAQLVTGVRNPHFWLECYMRVANQMACDAMVQGVLGAWLFAFARGVSCVLTLHSHTEEGGYARRALMNADYPSPRGWINAPRDRNAFNVFNELVRTDIHYVLADCIEILLQCAGLLHDAEPLASGIVNGDAFATVIKCDPTISDARIATPVDFPGLLGVMQEWQRHAIANLPVWQGHSTSRQAPETSGSPRY